MMKVIVKRTISGRTAALESYLTAARRLALAALCALLLVSSALAQQGRPEERPAPDEAAAEAATTEKAPDPNEAVTPVDQSNGRGGSGGGSQTMNGDLIFTSPGQFLYPRDIRMSDTFGVMRLYAANTLTTPAVGASMQLFGNNAGIYSGQMYVDSGALDSSALIFRTARTGGTLAERMRVTAGGFVTINTNTGFGRLSVKDDNFTAVHGSSSKGKGIEGYSQSGIGVFGVTDNSFGDGIGVYGYNSSGSAGGSGYAGYFHGNVHVTGTLSKNAGSFKIDHPLDPENKYLSHSFVESPDMMNIYNGNVTLDRRGRAVVTLPSYFEALNREFRYQLTALGAPANLYVAEKIKGNTFRIAGGKPDMEVSWQVTGVRQDAYAEKHRIPVEEEKPAQERGTYLNPEAFGQPAKKGVNHARHSASTPQTEGETRKETLALKRTATGRQ